MSTAAYDLVQKGSTWWVRTTLPSGKRVEFSTATSNRAKAEGIADTRVPQKHAISKAGMKRWTRKAKTTEKIRAALKLEPDPPPAPAPAPAPSSPPPTPAPAPSSAPADPGPRRDAVGEARAAELAGKLRAIGDGQDTPHGPDEGDYIPPGAERGDEKTEDRIEDEDAELLAEIMAQGTIAGWVKLNANAAKKAKPPKRLNEPHEKMTDWLGQGLRHNYAKLVGRTTALGPTAKMLFGLVGMTLSMWWGAEDLEPSPRPAKDGEPRGPDGGANGAARGPAAGPSPSNVLTLGRFS